MAAPPSPKYSLIVPVYNEENVIPELYARIAAAIADLDGTTELILVDDGSTDRSLQFIRALRQRDARVCYLSFGRNFGHQTAVTAGLNFARGEAVIVLDADLQDPPELIPELIACWQQGYQVVYARRTRRHKEKWVKRAAAYWFYRLLRYLADVDIPTDTGDFCLMDRQVVAALNRMPEHNRYIRGLRAWVGLKQTAISFERSPRFAGEVKYTFRKSLALAIGSLVSFSKVPLRLSTYLGLAAAALALFTVCLVIYWRLTIPDSPITGLTIVITVALFIGSVQLITIGILGEYVGQIYDEVKGRPLYVLAEVAGFSPPVSGQGEQARQLAPPPMPSPDPPPESDF